MYPASIRHSHPDSAPATTPCREGEGDVGRDGGALAAAEVLEHPGTGSALLGFVQWVAAHTIAPIAGIGGDQTAVPMALLMVGGAAASMIGLLLIAKPPSNTRR